MAAWSEDQEDLLIQLVEDRLPLYDVSERAYSDKIMKARLWREVEENLQMTEKDVRQRWASLRTQYSRYKKTGEGRTMRQSWILSRLQFLEPHIKNRDRESFQVTFQEEDCSAIVFNDENDCSNDNESDASMSAPVVTDVTTEPPDETPVAHPPPSPLAPPRPPKRKRQGPGEEPTGEESATATVLGILAQTLTRLNQPKPRDRISSYLAALDDQIRYLSPPMQTMFMCDIQKRYSELVMQEELFGHDCDE